MKKTRVGTAHDGKGVFRCGYGLGPSFYAVFDEGSEWPLWSSSYYLPEMAGGLRAALKAYQEAST